MTGLSGMNPAQVRAKAAQLTAQLAVLDSAAASVERAAVASLNPLSYGIQPGGLIIAPFAIGGTQRAAAQVRAAHASVVDLAYKLFEEAHQQEIVSNSSDASYKRGYIPKVSKVPQPKSAPDFWDGLLGKSGASILSMVDMAVGVTGYAAERLVAGSKLAKILGAAGKAFGAIGIVSGAYETVAGLLEGDGFRAADGLVGIGFGVLAFVTIANPIGLAVVVGLGVAWGIGSLLSGDVPVSKRIVDFGGWVGDKAVSGVKSVGGAISSGIGAATKGVSGFVNGITRPFAGVFG